MRRWKQQTFATHSSSTWEPLTWKIWDYFTGGIFRCLDSFFWDIMKSYYEKVIIFRFLDKSWTYHLLEKGRWSLNLQPFHNLESAKLLLKQSCKVTKLAKNRALNLDAVTIFLSKRTNLGVHSNGDEYLCCISCRFMTYRPIQGRWTLLQANLYIVMNWSLLICSVGDICLICLWI